MKTDSTDSIYEKRISAFTPRIVPTLPGAKRNIRTARSGQIWKLSDWLIEFAMVSLIWFTIFVVMMLEFS